jgi:ubiquinone/menaquinone biosynthesis C-methylase UbiE
MQMHGIMVYTHKEIQSTYQRVNDLLVTKYIIKNYSTNPLDIRKVAIDGLDLKRVTRVLELGCGYGFFIEILKDQLDPSAHITGIDLVENNREAYLNTIGSIGYNGEFIRDNVEIIESFDTASMDLIIACYSLYFFPHIIHHIARVLKPNGLFITITHSKLSLNEILSMIRDCLIEMGIDSIYTLSLQELIMSFSTENGSQLLEKYFRKID